MSVFFWDSIGGGNAAHQTTHICHMHSRENTHTHITQHCLHHVTGHTCKLHIQIPQLTSSLVFSQFLSVNLKVTVSWVVTAQTNHDKYISGSHYPANMRRQRRSVMYVKRPSVHQTSETGSIFEPICKVLDIL